VLQLRFVYTFCLPTNKLSTSGTITGRQRDFTIEFLAWWGFGYNYETICADIICSIVSKLNKEDFDFYEQYEDIFKENIQIVSKWFDFKARKLIKFKLSILIHMDWTHIYK